MRVRVLAVQRARDVVDAGVTYLVTFGRMVDLSDEIRVRVVSAGQAVPAEAKDVAVNSLVLITPFEKGPPYRVDSEWDLTVEADGRVSLKPVEG